MILTTLLIKERYEKALLKNFRGQHHNITFLMKSILEKVKN